MDLRDYIDILRARWRLITVTTLLGVMAAALASMLATPMYTATATTFVSVNGGDTVGTVNERLHRLALRPAAGQVVRRRR